MSIEYFVESIRRKPVSTKWTFDKMTLRQKAISTKWLSRRSVVRRSVVYPSLMYGFASLIKQDINGYGTVYMPLGVI